jgi:hypothetical protein
MNATAFLHQLEDLGVTVRAVGGRVRVEGPREALTTKVRREVAARKSELLGLLPTDEGPTQGAPGPNPPERWSGRLAVDEETATVFARFADYGTQPAWDDLAGAVCLEKRRTWCEETLEAVYTGKLTLAMLPDGQLTVFPRGIAS